MRRFVGWLVLLTLFASHQAAAEPPNRRAKALFEEGLKHYNVGDYKEALQSFKDGYFVKPDPIFLFNMGQCYRQLGDPEAAARQYRAYLRESPDAPNRPDAEKFIAAAEAQIQARAATAPPTGVIAPPAGSKSADEATASQPAPAAVVTVPVEALSADQPPPHRRRWVWPVVGAAIGVVVVVGVAVGLSLGLPNNASVKSGTDPSFSPTFH